MTAKSQLTSMDMTRWARDGVGIDMQGEGQKIDDMIDTLKVLTDGMVAGATIDVAAEDNNVRAIAIQLTDASGADIASVQSVQIGVFLNAGATAFVVTGGSTGIAIGTDGALLAIVAKKLFLATCEADGDIDLTWTDTGTEAAYLGVILPNGKIVMSAALTNT
jgi:hypothetical protein